MDLTDLQRRVIGSDDFDSMEGYFNVCRDFLQLLGESEPTRIISPTEHDYVFFQFGEEFGHKITRPLNTSLFIEKSPEFQRESGRFVGLLNDLRVKETDALTLRKNQEFVSSNGINRVVYTVQQSIGSIGDSFENANQSRKRVGMLFEQLVKQIIQEIGLDCEPRRISIPIAGYPDASMSYQLDVVISRGKAIVTS